MKSYTKRVCGDHKSKLLRLTFSMALAFLGTINGCKNDMVTALPPQIEEPKGIIGSWNWL